MAYQNSPAEMQDLESFQEMKSLSRYHKKWLAVFHMLLPFLHGQDRDIHIVLNTLTACSSAISQLLLANPSPPGLWQLPYRHWETASSLGVMDEVY